MASNAGRSARPGRGEGLHDRGTLCLWRWISPVDLKQGSVGNCWLISAIAALAEWPEMVKSLIAQHKLAHGRFDVTLFHPVGALVSSPSTTACRSKTPVMARFV